MLLFVRPSFAAHFLPTKGSLMHFIQGALTLHGASLKENRAEAKRRVDILEKLLRGVSEGTKLAPTIQRHAFQFNR